MLPENMDEAELKGNAFASLETFVAVGRYIPVLVDVHANVEQREQTSVPGRNSFYVWPELC